MDFSLDSWTDLATFSVVLAAALSFVAWLAKGWIEKAVAKMSDEITPHLTNGETSVAVYAHQARDAAELAKTAALDSKSAALDAKDAARSASATADRIELVVEKIDLRVKTLAIGQGEGKGISG